MAYLAANAIDATQLVKKNWTIQPILFPIMALASESSTTDRRPVAARSPKWEDQGHPSPAADFAGDVRRSPVEEDDAFDDGEPQPDST